MALSQKPNIILIVFDTLRWDYFQRFIENDTILKKALKEFINFNMAFSPSPWTLPSHFSLFTGLYPKEHGIHETPNSELKDVFRKARDYTGKFITEIASLGGYKTVGISTNPMISDLTGFKEKFDEFYTIDPGSFLGILSSKTHSRPIQIIKFLTSRAILHFRGFPWNKGYRIALSLFNKKMIDFNPLFVFMNFMEMHEPYNRTILFDDFPTSIRDMLKIESLKEKEINKLRTRYYNQINKVRETILNLIKTLQNLKKFDNSLVIFTSDHGQALKERGYYGHGTFLYDELIHIPLMIKPPIQYSNKHNPMAYVNLVDIFSFLRAVITGENNPFHLLSKDHTFAEAFGLHLSKSHFKKYLTDTKAREAYLTLNAPRKAIIKDGIKLCADLNSYVGEYNTLVSFGEELRQY